MYMASQSGYRRRYRAGLGASTSLFDSTPGSSGHGICSALYWNFNPLALLDSDCKAGAVPLPAPPVPAPAGVLLTVGAQPSADAVYSGSDSNGNTVWATSQTPDATWQAYKQALQSFYTGLDAQNQAACGAKGWVWDASGTCAAPAAPPSVGWLSWLAAGAVLLGIGVMASR